MKQKIIYAGIAILLFTLIATNIYTFIALNNYRQRLEGQDEVGSNSQNYPTSTPTPLPPESTFVPDPSPASQIPGDYEANIIDVTEKFLTAYYTTDTHQSPEDYLAGFDGLLTVNGLQNMGDVLIRPPINDEAVRIERQLVNCEVYIKTQNSQNATAFCFVYVCEKVSVTDEAPSITYAPLMIRLELKCENAAWLINSLGFERSLSTLPMNISDLFA